MPSIDDLGRRAGRQLVDHAASVADTDAAWRAHRAGADPVLPLAPADRRRPARAVLVGVAAAVVALAVAGLVLVRRDGSERVPAGPGATDVTVAPSPPPPDATAGPGSTAANTVPAPDGVPALPGDGDLAGAGAGLPWTGYVGGGLIVQATPDGFGTWWSYAEDAALRSYAVAYTDGAGRGFTVGRIPDGTALDPSWTVGAVQDGWVPFVAANGLTEAEVRQVLDGLLVDVTRTDDTPANGGFLTTVRRFRDPIGSELVALRGDQAAETSRCLLVGLAGEVPARPYCYVASLDDAAVDVGYVSVNGHPFLVGFAGDAARADGHETVLDAVSVPLEIGDDGIVVQVLPVQQRVRRIPPASTDDACGPDELAAAAGADADDAGAGPGGPPWAAWGVHVPACDGRTATVVVTPTVPTGAPATVSLVRDGDRWRLADPPAAWAWRTLAPVPVMEALVSARVEVGDACVLLRADDGTTVPAVWPAGTVVEGGRVVLADGRQLADGSRVEAGGGFLPPDGARDYTGLPLALPAGCAPTSAEWFTMGPAPEGILAPG